MPVKAFLAVLVGMLLSAPSWAFTLCIEDIDYPPFTLSNERNEPTGLLPEMVQLAVAENDDVITVLRYPWKRCIDKLRKGQVDALLAAIWSPERDAWGAFPKYPDQPLAAPNRRLRLWSEEYRVFVPLQGTLRYDGEHFTGLQTGIGAPPGYVVWQRLKDAGALNDSVLQPKAGLRLVALNRLDGYVAEYNIGLHQLQALGISEQVTLLPQVYHADDAYLVFSHQFQRAQPQLTQAIWQSLGKIRRQHGKRLLAKYRNTQKP